MCVLINNLIKYFEKYHVTHYFLENFMLNSDSKTIKKKFKLKKLCLNNSPKISFFYKFLMSFQALTYSIFQSWHFQNVVCLFVLLILPEVWRISFLDFDNWNLNKMFNVSGNILTAQKMHHILEIPGKGDIVVIL